MNEETFINAFRLFDSEKTGQVDEEQFFQIMKQFFPNISQIQLTQLFETIDINNKKKDLV